MANVIVPPMLRQEWLGPDEVRWYDSAQWLLAEARAAYPEHPDLGVSLIVSGITRELRRHYPIAEIQDMLHKLADTTPEAAKGDLP